jgi:hypothetical protein
MMEQLAQHQCLVMAEPDDNIVAGVTHTAHHGHAGINRSCREEGDGMDGTEFGRIVTRCPQWL